MLGVSVLQEGSERVGIVTAPSYPDLLVVALVVGVVILLAGLVWWFRVSDRPPGAVFRKRLGEPAEVAVLMHSQPDPDAMASAIAVKHIAEQAGTRATIQYPGQIRRSENRAFRTVLDLEFDQIETAQEIAADAVVLVDHGRPRGFQGVESITPYAVVDHHPGSDTGTFFTDVRADYGACATILAEYFQELDAERVASEDEDATDSDGVTLPSKLATGLAYGILSDTRNLTRGCSSADFAAMDYLYPSVDEDLLDRIANPQVDAEVLDVLSDAIAERDQRSPYAVSDVDEIENLDAIPRSADKLLLLEGVTAVVVLGEKDGRLHISGRSRDDRVHVGRALENAVDNIPMSGAGGHARMGGGQISIEHMKGLGPSEGVSREEFRERLFDALAGEE